MASKTLMEDMWTQLDNDRQRESADTNSDSKSKGEGAGSGSPSQFDENLVNSTVIMVGDSGSGKSTLIQTFMSPKNTKETKPTVALDFNFVRKTANGVKSVGIIWEVGGDLAVTPKLLEIGLSSKNFLRSSVIITCDLSKPYNVLSSLIRNITVVRELVARRSAELQSTNVHALAAARDRQLAAYETNHPDANRVKLCEVPLYIVATKFDTFKNMNSADRRSIIQMIRFVGHYYSASLFVADKAGAGDGALKDTFRSVLTSAAFQAPMKPAFETNIDRAPYMSVTRGQDSFHHILVQTQTPSEAKSRLITDERDIDLYITHKGATKECWKRCQDHMTALFGAPDAAPSADGQQSGAQMETGAEEQRDLKNPFPEPEVDEMRVMKDAALERMIQENVRKQEMLSKMAA